jgi:hypothetical protein
VSMDELISHDADRLLKLERLLEDRIVALRAEREARGFSAAEVLDALDVIFKRQRSSLQADPDPADDPI